ncbi:MAG: type I glutamate--ammonia ligase [Alphaproteobacteria bacterium]|nr:type I glutamate--ammonia ligase [Alphaproteobacteria bacterium]
MSKAETILKKIKEENIKYVSFRFTDPRGKWHHFAQMANTVKDALEEGLMFDGSSIEGWKAINESDMMLMPDVERAFVNPFPAEPELVMFCDVIDPTTNKPYNRDPRSIAKKSVAYLNSTGLADTAYFGPEAEFFVFDSARWSVEQNLVAYSFDSDEWPSNSWKEYEDGNSGHRPRKKGGYFPVPPMDRGVDFRAEMLDALTNMGLAMEKHHHEVAPAQHELGMKYDTLVNTADNMQIYKFGVHNVAESFGKTATFMPKPLYGDNGSGMHVHISLWSKGENTFAKKGAYADLSESALYFIGGVIKHARALNAFTNPSTNSYKRLIPGFEAPVLLAYSARNRSASCRIPHVGNLKAKRVEFRFPDPLANPYLCYSALLMAGLDGIKNKIHPGEPMDKDLYHLPPEELKKIPTVCNSLRQALESLESDHAFLTAGDVFTKDFLESYAALLWDQVYRLEHNPHPVEYDMYYSH